MGKKRPILALRNYAMAPNTLHQKFCNQTAGLIQYFKNLMPIPYMLQTEVAQVPNYLNYLFFL